jgi:protein-S-isoprenylcysteine O-methyltransferase Ste14
MSTITLARPADVFNPRRFMNLLLDAGLPALFFSLVSLSQGMKGGELAAAWTQTGQALLAIEALHSLLTMTFMGMVTVLFLVRKQPIGRGAGLPERLVAVSGAFIMTAVVIMPEAPISTTERIVATALMAIGQVVALGGLFWLRRCFAISPEARGLVTSGPYRFIRHPLYAGEFVTAAGMAVYAMSAPAVLVFLAFVALQLGRVAFEERALTAAFPEEYAAYAARTPRFIPGLV